MRALLLSLGFLGASFGFKWLAYVHADDGRQSGDRDSTFQVLADGTQDLAALVGLFATDSVERYSVDYSRGYVSVAMATCSLLGILGYVRALVKLAMGSQSCQDSAFPTQPVRSMLGVAKADRLPKDELALVTYITREINPLDKSTTYRVTKQVYHTEESFLGADSCFAHFKPTTPEGVRRELRFKSDKSILWMIWVSLLISAAATSIPVVFISGQWSWSRIMGSFGLFTGLAVSSVMWSHAYIKEQLPTSQNNEDWNDPKNFALVTSASPSRLFVIGNIQAVAEGGLQIYRAVSLFMAAVISLGYICQYIEIRRSNTAQAAWWLGVHTGLALLRIIVWIVDPQFDNFHHSYTSETPLWSIHFFSARDLASIHFLNPGTSRMRTVSPLVEAGETSADRDEKRKVETLRFPQSFLERMEQQDPDYIQDDVDATIDRLLQQAVDIVKSDIIPSALRDGLINNCTAVWVFPRFLFARWLGYHSGNKSAIEESTGYHNAMIVNIGGLAPWVGGEIWLIPMLSHQNWDDTSEIRVATNTSTLSETLWYERGAFREASDTARASDKEGRYQKYLPPLGESDANLDLFLTELQAALDYMKRGPNAHRPESAVNLIYQPSDRSSVGGGDVTIDIIEPVEKPDSIRSGIKNGEVIVNVGPVN